MRLGITGHRGLPVATADLVKAALEEHIQGYERGTLVAVSMIADGPDSWFADMVLKHGGALEVVVPAREYRRGLPEEHHATYDRLLIAAQNVYGTDLVKSTPRAHMAGSKLVVDRVDRLVAVWNGGEPQGVGGTADVVAHAREVKVPVDVIWPDGATRD